MHKLTAKSNKNQSEKSEILLILIVNCLWQVLAPALGNLKQFRYQKLWRRRVSAHILSM